MKENLPLRDFPVAFSTSSETSCQIDLPETFLGQLSGDFSHTIVRRSMSSLSVQAFLSAKRHFREGGATPSGSWAAQLH